MHQSPITFCSYSSCLFDCLKYPFWRSIKKTLKILPWTIEIESFLVSISLLTSRNFFWALKTSSNSNSCQEWKGSCRQPSTMERTKQLNIKVQSVHKVWTKAQPPQFAHQNKKLGGGLRVGGSWRGHGEEATRFFCTSHGPTSHWKNGTVIAALSSADHFVGGNNLRNCIEEKGSLSVHHQKTQARGKSFSVQMQHQCHRGANGAWSSTWLLYSMCSHKTHEQKKSALGFSTRVLFCT